MSGRAQGIVRAVRAVEGSNCSGWLGMTKDGPPMRCPPIDSEQSQQVSRVRRRFQLAKATRPWMSIRAGGQVGGSVAESNWQQAPAEHTFLVGVWECYWNSGISSLAIVSTWRARSSRGQEILKTMCLAPASMYSLSRSAQFSTGPRRQYRWTMLMKSAPYR